VNLASRFPLYALGWAMLSASMMSIIAKVGVLLGVAQ